MNSIFADYSGDWYIPFVGDDVVANRLSVSVSCIRYSKRRKFRPKLRQNAFGGRAPSGPLGELERPPGSLAAVGGAYF